MSILRKKRQIMSVCFLLIILVISICLMNHSEADHAEDYCRLVNDWEIQLDQDTYSHVNLDDFHFDVVNRGDYIKMQTTLPERKIADPVLRIYTIHSELSVALDDQEIYHYGHDLHEENRLLGYGYHFIDLTDDYSGKVLTIQLWVTEDNAFTYLETPQIDNELTQIRNYVIQKKIPLAVNLFLIVFGVCVLVASGLFVGGNIKFGQLICVGFFSSGIGLWSLCNYDLMLLFTYDLRVKVYMEFISLYVTPVFVMLYFWEEATVKRSRAFRVGYYAALACQGTLAVMAIVLQALNLVHLPALLKYEHVLLVFIFTGIIAVIAVDYKNHTLHNQALVMGIGIMIVVGLTDLLRFNLDKFDVVRGGRYTSNICIGALICVLAQIIDFSMGISRKLYETAQRDILKEMAYTDELTGIANRRKCEDKWDELENADNYGILAFDLNHLKKVNDSQGHESGDNLIKNFAHCIQKAFGEYATVGRMGGDEFVVIFDDMDKVQIEELIDAYHAGLAECNLHNAGLHMSAAYGFCSKKEKPDLDARGIYRKADSRMYENKVAMKCQRTD